MGFLPTSREATLVFDILWFWTGGLVTVLTWSLYVVRYKRGYSLHKTLQLYLTGALIVALFWHGINPWVDSSWLDRVLQSPYHQRGLLTPALVIHRVISYACCVLWLWTIVYALNGFESPPTPSKFSRDHIRLARLATGSVYGTALTGWIYYWMAFVAD